METHHIKSVLYFSDIEEALGEAILEDVLQELPDVKMVANWGIDDASAEDNRIILTVAVTVESDPARLAKVSVDEETETVHIDITGLLTELGRLTEEGNEG